MLRRSESWTAMQDDGEGRGERPCIWQRFDPGKLPIEDKLRRGDRQTLDSRLEREVEELNEQQGEGEVDVLERMERLSGVRSLADIRTTVSREGRDRFGRP